MPTSACEVGGLGVDVGGTFTDLAAVVDGQVITAKVPSTPEDQSDGVLRAIAATTLDRARVRAFAHGTTVATNALLERRGARTALVTTQGFRDVVEIGRQDRPSLYDLARNRPTPLVPRELRFTVRERTGPTGVIEPLDERSLKEVILALRCVEVEAVAVCLLFGFLHPDHEWRVGEAIRRAMPYLHVSLSCEVLPEVREYERFSTTVADAYLTPRLAGYFRRLGTRAHQAGVPAPRVMQSSGGVADLDAAARTASAFVLSGPAGGVVGAAYVAGASGYRDLLTFDMGGTSTDVAAIVDGQVLTTTDASIAGIPLRHPMVDVHTVSAGGGSIARADAGGALRVGPDSAGAAPGPACYGRGGLHATVTDADVLLGYIADRARLGGEVAIDRKRASRALAAAGQPVRLRSLEAALGVVRVANAEMVRALRVISVERGLDPRDFALVAFGGAGGMHACALAEELRMEAVLVPRASGVLSALGLAVSDLRRDYVRPLIGDLAAVGREELESGFADLEARAWVDLQAPECARAADLRYRGQSFELTVAADDIGALRQHFHTVHERRYGYRMEAEPVELVSLRLVATVARERPALREPPPRPGAARAGRRRACFDGMWLTVDVHRREALGTGSTVQGPAIVEFPEATCVVRPGWSGVVDAVGTLILQRR